MKREITHSELFNLANRRASDLIAADKRPARFTVDPVTRALSQAFREMYAQYTVVTTTSAQEQVRR
jgi:hypothetical protein